MKGIVSKVLAVVLLALTAELITAQAQTCSTPDAQITSPAPGSTLPVGAVTFDWCNAGGDYFLTIESVHGAHDIFYAIVRVTSITLGPQCAVSPPLQCIPPDGEPIFVKLQTKIKGVWNSGFDYTFTAGNTSGTVQLSPTSLNLGSVMLGTHSATRKIVLTNVGGGNLTVSAVSASGNYSETDTCAGHVLPPSATCSILVTFNPSNVGVIPGALTITDDASNSPQVAALTGRGLPMVSLAPASLAFGTVPVGTSSSPMAATIVNNSTSSVTFTFAGSSNYSVFGSGTKPCTGTLGAGGTCTMSVVFSPTANGVADGTLAVSSASFPTQISALAGTGSGAGPSPLSFAPAQLAVSGVLGETSPAKTVTVTNVSAAAVNISNFVASADFHVVGSGVTPCGMILGSGASCTVAVTFSPSVTGPIPGSVTFMDNASINTQVYDISGRAVAPVTFSPPTLTFPAQSVGTTSIAQTVTLRNNRSVILNLAGFGVSGQYTVMAGGAHPCGNTVAAHGTCTFVVTFSPKQIGTVPGVVTVLHDAPGNPQVIKLSGTGQ